VRVLVRPAAIFVLKTRASSSRGRRHGRRLGAGRARGATRSSLGGEGRRLGAVGGIPARDDRCTRNVCEARRGGVRRLIHISSIRCSAITPDAQTIDERFDRVQALPVGFYSKSKVAAERLVLEAHKRKQIEVTVIRRRGSTASATERRSRGW